MLKDGNKNKTTVKLCILLFKHLFIFLLQKEHFASLLN